MLSIPLFLRVYLLNLLGESGKQRALRTQARSLSRVSGLGF